MSYTPLESSQLIEQIPTESSQLIELRCEIPTESSQLIQLRCEIPTESSQLIELRCEIPTESSQLIELRSEIPTGQGIRQEKIMALESFAWKTEIFHLTSVKHGCVVVMTFFSVQLYEPYTVEKISKS